MRQYYEVFCREAMRTIDQMTTTQWFVVLVMVVVIGCICLRGFGSRTNY